MMNHPASDITKVLKSKKNLKTKKNFQFRFNNIRRENGSVGTVLSAEESTFPSYSKNTKINWYKVRKESLKPCSVQLTRLSQIELISCGYKTISECNKNVKGSTQLNKHCNSEPKMRKSFNNKSVDKTQLHLELEKVASTFASEVKDGNCFQYENYFDNPENFPLTRKENASKSKAVQKAVNREQTNIVLKVSVDNVTQKSQLKKQTGQKNKASSLLSATHNNYASGSESDEEWLGWNSKVTPLDIIPGAEIVSVEENQHIEDIINWNMKVESESDMDVEEVFLLTDLEEINHKTACIESVTYSSDEEWPGWPEQKPSTALCYLFNV